MINYPHIKELPKEYSIFGKNPYYYGLKETNNNLLINSLYNNERIKVYQDLEFFYKNNKKNLFYLLTIKNLTRSNNFKYSYFNNHLKNIPLDLFQIELFDNKPGIKSIEFKNYLIEYTTKNFIRKEFLSTNIEPTIYDKMRGGNKGNLFEDLFDLFFISDELPFQNIKSVSQLIVDKIFNDTKIIDKKLTIIEKLDNENIFISQDNDNAPDYDSALILSLNGKKILIIFQATESKKTETIKKKYKISKLEKNLENTSNSIEKLLGIKIDIVEFMFVLNYYTYKKKASNIIKFCNEQQINYILFDYKKFKLYDKNDIIIDDLRIDPNSIIIDKSKKKENEMKLKEEGKQKKEEEEEKDDEEEEEKDDDEEEEIDDDEEEEIDDDEEEEKDDNEEEEKDDNEEEEEKKDKNKINISKKEDDKNQSGTISDDSYNEVKSLLSEIKNSDNEINNKKGISLNKSGFNKESNEFNFKYKIFKKITIKSKDNIKIGICKVKDGSYINQTIISKIYNTKYGIKGIKYKYRILLLNKISIQQLFYIYILNNNEFIHIKNEKNN